MPIQFKTASIGGETGPNQDTVYVQELKRPGEWLAAIADGIGGLTNGEFASRWAIDAYVTALESDRTITMREAFSNARASLIRRARENNFSRPSGTTLTAIRCRHNRVEVAHVGDTRLYHLRGRGIQKKTVDQTEATALVDQGILSRREALKYHRKNVLTSAIVTNKNFELYETEFQALTGDRIMLITDGIEEVISARDIRDMSIISPDLNNFRDRMVDSIKYLCPRDDATFALIEIIG